MVKNGNLTLPQISSGHELQFHIATEMSSGQEWHLNYG